MIVRVSLIINLMMNLCDLTQLLHRPLRLYTRRLKTARDVLKTNFLRYPRLWLCVSLWAKFVVMLCG